MDNWIDLSNIPKYKTRSKNVNDWKNSLGCKCNFSYNGILGNFIIKDYDSSSRTLTVLCNGKEKKVNLSSIMHVRLKTIVGLRDKNFKIDVGARFNDNSRDISITHREQKTDQSGIMRKMYKYHCNICNWSDGWIEEGHLLNGVGCSCCAKSVIVPYVNDLYTTNPELIKYFKNTRDTHFTTTCNKKNFLMVCPNCGNEQMYSTDKLYTQGFSCKKCGDGISYGEKYLYALLQSLNVDFITQLSHTTFKWCEKYKYDFYIPKLDTIIEVHGKQHYLPEGTSELFGCNKANDIEKERVAKSNGISNYIVIDCRKSNLQYIKASILSSKLLELLNVHEKDIDWVKCDRFTSKSFIVEVCDYKNKHPELSTTDIGKVFHMARTTVQKHLQKGHVLGICIYNKEIESKCRFMSKNERLNCYKEILKEVI